MSNVIASTANLIGAAVAFLVVAVSYFRGIGVETTIVRAGFAGVGAALLFRLCGFGAVRALRAEPNAGTKRAADAGSQENADAERATKKRAA